MTARWAEERRQSLGRVAGSREERQRRRRWWCGGGGDPVAESDSCSGGWQGHQENEEGCRAGEVPVARAGDRRGGMKRWEGKEQQEEENTALIRDV